MTPFQEIVREKIPFLRWNQEMINSLKHPFFSKSRKKVKTFQKTPIFKKTRKTFKWWLFTIFINIRKFIIQRQFVCLNYFKNTLLISLFISQSQVHWKQLIADRSQERSKYSVKIYPFLGGFTKFKVKNTTYHDFAKFALKYPYFREIWNTH